MIRFSCPGCQMTLTGSPAQAGVIVACPKCKRQMKVPFPVSTVVATPPPPLSVPERNDVSREEILQNHEVGKTNRSIEHQEIPVGVAQEDLPPPLPGRSTPISDPPATPATSDDKWFYSQHGERHGPVSMAQLKELVASGRLGRACSVWKRGMQAWVQADSLTH